MSRASTSGIGDLGARAPCGLVATDRDGLILAANDRFCAWIGANPRDVIGKSRFRDALSLASQVMFDAQFGPLMHMQGEMSEIALDLATPDGGRMPVLLSAAIEADDAGAVRLVRLALVTALDRRAYERELLSERRQAEQAREEATFQASHDGLTGLRNRAAITRDIETALRSDHPFSILLVDLDRFKAVNDTHGHAAGDQLLQDVSQRMKLALRHTDQAARLGGDEFAVLLDAADNRIENAAQVAGRLVAAISAPYTIDGRPISIGASIGVALAPEHGETVGALLSHADAALYKVKSSGRNDFRIFDDTLAAEAELAQATSEKLRASLLGDSLLGDMFKLAYMPTRSLLDGRLLGLDALPTWRDEAGSALVAAPAAALFERAGLGDLLARHMITQVCADLARLPGDLPVTLRLEAAWLTDDLVDWLIEAINAQRQEPERLRICVGEEVIARPDDHRVAELYQIKAIGIGVALDGVGRPGGSLNALIAFPFDALRLDAACFDDIGQNPRRTALLCAIIGYARSVDMAIIVGGLADDSHRPLLVAAGCVAAQGPLIGAPSPIEALAKTQVATKAA